ncbi:MAG: hypothetical protein HOW73_22700 [Polyangiaceae bacterium]|nr:hypothetical protein [Polyangiaceae bacterium]
MIDANIKLLNDVLERIAMLPTPTKIKEKGQCPACCAPLEPHSRYCATCLDFLMPPYQALSRTDGGFSTWAI